MLNTYLICSTPRTGSTLLCQYLTSTEVAGRPHSYFRSEDMTSRAKGWRIIDASGFYSFSDYLIAARAAASSENGMIAIRLMWESLEEVTEALGKLYSTPTSHDLELLEKAFGKLKFIYLSRKDVISQAISLYRAEQTGHWHTVEGQEPDQHPEYNFDAIYTLMKTIEAQNSAWQDWIHNVGLEPMTLTYEELGADPIGCTRRVLEFLGLELPHYKRLEAPNQRLADELTVLWVEQFTKQLQEHTA